MMTTGEIKRMTMMKITIITLLTLSSVLFSYDDHNKSYIFASISSLNQKQRILILDLDQLKVLSSLLGGFRRDDTGDIERLSALLYLTQVHETWYFHHCPSLVIRLLILSFTKFYTSIIYDFSSICTKP
jgi:hypothetical protein